MFYDRYRVFRNEDVKFFCRTAFCQRAHRWNGHGDIAEVFEKKAQIFAVRCGHFERLRGPGSLRFMFRAKRPGGNHKRHLRTFVFDTIFSMA
jgi:hypothetical protein